MPVTPELLTKIDDYRKQGYSNDEIVQGLAQSANFPDVAQKVKAYSKGGYSPDEILQGIATSPVAKSASAPVAATPATDENGQPVLEVTADAPNRNQELYDSLKGGMSVAEAMGKGLIKDKYDLDRAKYILKELPAADKVDGVPQWGRDNPNLYAARMTLAGLARPTLEGVGTVGGAMVGSGVGPVGTLTGAGLGYAAGKGIADLISGDSAEKTPTQLATGTLADLATGAEMEMGGQLLGKGIGYGLTKASQLRGALRGATPAITEKGLNAKAGQVLLDNMGDAPVYEQNAAEAAKVNIPGYKPSLAEMRNDPALIKLQRSVERSSGKAADIILEKKAANQAAVRDYLQNEFTGDESIDDVIKALAQKKSALEQGSKQAGDFADLTKNALNPTDTQTIGRNIADSVDEALQPVKAAEKEAWAKVPNYPLPSENFDAAAAVLRKTPLEADTKAAVGKILDFAAEMPRTTEGLQSIERTINDKMYAPNADPNVKRVLGSLKKAIGDDFAAVGKAADSGDIALSGDKVVYPSKLQSELANVEARIAEEQGKAAAPDVDGMRNALMDKGIPAMKQMGEKPDLYTARLAKEYERVFGQPAPTVAAESKTLPDLIARKEQLTSQLDTLQPAEDVAKAYRAAKDVSKDRFDRFGKGAIADITKGGSQASGRRLPDALIPAKVFTKDGADDFIRAVGKEEAAKHADQFAAQDLLSKANPLTGELAPKTVAQWLNKNMGLLRKYGIGSKYADVARATAQADAARAAESEFTKSVASRVLNADVDKALTSAFATNARSTETVTRELMEQVKGNPQALKGLQNAFKDFIVSTAETTAKTIEGDNIISPAAIQKTMAKYTPAMRVLYEDDPAKIVALTKVNKAVEIQSRSSRSPLGGGSDTAENANVAKSIMNKVLDLPVLGAVTRWGRLGLSTLGKLNEGELNKVIARALYDPELAQTLMMAARRYSPRTVEKRISSQLITLGLPQPARAIRNEQQPYSAPIAGTLAGAGASN